MRGRPVAEGLSGWPVVFADVAPNPCAPPRTSKRLACVALLSATVVLVLAASGPSLAYVPKLVDETRTVHPGEWAFVILYGGPPTTDVAVNLSWTSTVPIDVWLLNRTMFDNLDAGRPFVAKLTQSGLAGHMDLTVPLVELGNGSLHVVVDNSALGSTAPPSPPGEVNATVHVTGRFWFPDPPFVPDNSAALSITLFEAAVVGLPVVLIVVYVFRRVRRKDRREDIRREMAAGNVVGAGAPRAPETFLQKPPAPPAYSAPPQWGQAAASTPAPPRFCRSCGTPGVSGKTFCMQCGAPFGP